MANAKLSVSVDERYLPFIERYRAEHGVRTRSEVIESALALLRQRELERAYEEAAREWAENPDAALWDATAADGLARDAW